MRVSQTLTDFANDANEIEAVKKWNTAALRMLDLCERAGFDLNDLIPKPRGFPSRAR